MNIKESAALTRIKTNVIGVNPALFGPELEEIGH
jgi:hypothetical protein